MFQWQNKRCSSIELIKVRRIKKLEICLPFASVRCTIMLYERGRLCVSRVAPFRAKHSPTKGGGKMNLPNYVSGQWREGTGNGVPVVDPVTGDELARVSSQGIDQEAALAYARSAG